MKRNLNIYSKYFIIALSFLLFNEHFVFAHPPTSIDLICDKEENLINIEINHVARNIRKHYIRKVYVQINDAEPIKITYTKQEKVSGFNVELPTELESGDSVKVKTICSEAGRKEETFTIP